MARLARTLLALELSLASLASLAACGGGAHPTPNGPGTHAEPPTADAGLATPSAAATPNALPTAQATTVGDGKDGTAPTAVSDAASALEGREAGAGGAKSDCPADMVLVAGDYCPKVVQTCKRWLDPPPYQFFRCAEYAPSACVAPRVPSRFCIDREEYVRPGEPLPLAHLSWTSAGSVCEAQGKRLCKESEWQFACEGEQMHPYPYGTGLVRDATACNIDQPKLGKPQEGLLDLRAPTSAYPRCVSPFGVHDMSGNVEEWTTLDHGTAPNRSAMKGAWWLPGKNTCRAATLGHGEIYEGPQVGVRCCKDG